MGEAPRAGSDQLLLPGFEALIVHSQRMESYLRTQGVTCPMILMEAFDCLSEGKIPVREKSRMVAIAGNLAADKSGYLKDIGKVPLEWQLYGTNWAGSGSTRIEYHGEIAPEKLPETISGAFGIVWDGDSLDGLTGLYGAYALLISPHKLFNIPRGRTAGDCCEERRGGGFCGAEQVGVVLNSLRELPELIRAMPEEDYQRYAANARAVRGAASGGREHEAGHCGSWKKWDEQAGERAHPHWQSGRVQPDGAFSPNARAPSGKIQKNRKSPLRPSSKSDWMVVF